MSPLIWTRGYSATEKGIAEPEPGMGGYLCVNFANMFNHISGQRMTAELELTTRYGMRTDEFRHLMEFRVQDILLVASHYDTFVLEEEGQLTELLLEEYRNLALNLRFTPHFCPATTGAEALRLLAEVDRSFHMVVASPRLTDMEVGEFARRAKVLRPDLSVCVLAAHAWSLPELHGLQDSGNIDFLFLWQGDVKALLALIKQVEDRRNADQDVLEGGVQVIILVEDDVRLYSTYLPHIYTEVTTQTSRLMSEGLNLSHRLLRIRARPKILLAQTYEEAWDLFERYRSNILGVISDIGFPRDGVLNDIAGIEFARDVRLQVPDIPLLLQSSDNTHSKACQEIGVSFLHKRSAHMIEDLQRFIVDRFGFGDFVFKQPDGTEIARARDTREMIRALHEISVESIQFHAERNHFSTWFKARTEFELASRLRPFKVTEFTSIQELRQFLISSIMSYLRQIQRNVIIDFKGDSFDEYVAFARIGTGSLGGKGRGLAFAQKLLTQAQIRMSGVEIDIPQTVALASDVFEEFLAENGLTRLPQEVRGLSDDEILNCFRRSRFNHTRSVELASFLEKVTEPLAVRSSSILEDSLYQSFAGVYATVMLPNSHPSLDVRLAQLLEAIKLVYASTFLSGARDYLAGTPHRIEEERMAVLLQRLVGSRRGDLFYPTVSGVAWSYNFYPFGHINSEDGVAQVALGLGKTIVDGFEALRFCPKHPEILPQFSTTKDILRNAQRNFYGLDMTTDNLISEMPQDFNLLRRETVEAVKQGAHSQIVSSYVRENDAMYDGIHPRGSPLVTFAPLLKRPAFPLPELLSRVLELAQAAMECPVEIEFALDFDEQRQDTPALQLLQIRPMMVERMPCDVAAISDLQAKAIVYSESALGHGRGCEVTDLVVIEPARFDRSKTEQAATMIEHLNNNLSMEGHRYVLIGPGRWGSQDPWLGIPVRWSQISAAGAIVETDFTDLEVEPSHGSHFFHNITTFGVAFLTVHEGRGQGRIDWAWLERQASLYDGLDGAVRHIRIDDPLQVLVDGKTGLGVIVGKRGDELR